MVRDPPVAALVAKAWMRFAMVSRARLAMTYLGDNLPFRSRTCSFMLPEVSYTIANANPSSWAACNGTGVAMIAARAPKLVRRRMVAMSGPRRTRWFVLISRFMRCQLSHTLVAGIYKATTGL